MLGAIVAMAFPLGSTAASAPEPQPTIGTVTIGHLTSSTAMVEAQINPNGREALYEIEIVGQTPLGAGPNEFVQRFTGSGQGLEGRLAPGNEDVTVTATITNLTRGYIYFYRIYAASKGGGETDGEPIYSFGFECTDPYLVGEAPKLGYLARIPLWEIFSGEEAAKRHAEEGAAEERAAEHQSQLAREAEHQSQLAREAQERHAREIAEEEATLRRIEAENAAKRGSANPPTLSISRHRFGRRTLTLIVDAPGAGRVVARAKGLSTASRKTSGTEALRLTLHAKRRQSFRTRVTVIFTPSSGEREVDSVWVKA